MKLLNPKPLLGLALSAAALAAAGFPIDALAQTSPGGQSGPGSWSELQDIITALVNAGSSMTQSFVSLGTRLLAVFLLLQLTVMTYGLLTGDGAQQFIGRLFQSVVIASLPLVLISNWPLATSTIVGFFQQELPSAIGFGGGSSPIQLAGQALSSLLDAINDMIRAIDESIEKNNNAISVLQNPLGALANQLNGMLAGIAALFMVIIPAIALMLATILAVFGTILMLQVGIILGPLVLALMAWDVTRSWGVRWFGYMITHGMTFVVALIFVKIVEIGINNIAGNIRALEIDQSGSLVAIVGGMIGIGAMLLFMAFMMTKADNVAEAIGGWGGGTGGAGFLAGGAARGAVNSAKSGVGAMRDANKSAKAKEAATKQADAIGKAVASNLPKRPPIPDPGGI